MNLFFLTLLLSISTLGYASVYNGTVKKSGRGQPTCHVISPVKDCEGSIALSGFIGRCNTIVGCFQTSCLDSRCTVKGP